MENDETAVNELDAIADLLPSTATNTTSVPTTTTETTPWRHSCVFTQGFLPADQHIALRIVRDGNAISTPPGELLETEIQPGTTVEYTCAQAKTVYQGVKSTTCLESGRWSAIPHNARLKRYCVDPEHEAARQKVAYYMAIISTFVIFVVVVGFCCSCIVKRAGRKKKIRAAQLDRQRQLMFENQAYLENSSRFYEVTPGSRMPQAVSAGM